MFGIGHGRRVGSSELSADSSDEPWVQFVLTKNFRTSSIFEQFSSYFWTFLKGENRYDNPISLNEVSKCSKFGSLAKTKFGNKAFRKFNIILIYIYSRGIPYVAYLLTKKIAPKCTQGPKKCIN